MKKTLLALAGIALLIVGCKKAEPITDGTLLLEFGADTQTVDVAGTLTADGTYDWITMTQSGKKATFTVTTNVTGSIRTATYKMAGEANTAKFTVTQKSGTPAIFVKAGEDLQKAIDEVKEGFEIHVAGGATFNGPFMVKKKGTVISGGWNETFSKQDPNNLTVVTGQGKGRCFVFGNGYEGTTQAGDTHPKLPFPMVGTGVAKLSYFELKDGRSQNDAGDHHGSAVYVCGDVEISNCYIHDNKNMGSRRGAIAIVEAGDWGDDHVSNLTVANCRIENNSYDNLIYDNYNHGVAVAALGSTSTSHSYVTIINNLIVGNMGYDIIDIGPHNYGYVVNNTITGNGIGWAVVNYASEALGVIGNNLVVGNTALFISDKKDGDRVGMSFSLDPIAGASTQISTVQNFLVEGNIGEGEIVWQSSNPVADQTIYDKNVKAEIGVDLSTLYDSNYHPKGLALSKASTNPTIMEYIGKYPVDLAGNTWAAPMAVGCYLK